MVFFPSTQDLPEQCRIRSVQTTWKSEVSSINSSWLSSSFVKRWDFEASISLLKLKKSYHPRIFCIHYPSGSRAVSEMNFFFVITTRITSRSANPQWATFCFHVTLRIMSVSLCPLHSHEVRADYAFSLSRSREYLRKLNSWSCRRT